VTRELISLLVLLIVLTVHLQEHVAFATQQNVSGLVEEGEPELVVAAVAETELNQGLLGCEPERVDAWATKLRLDAPQVLVREQRQRWGSCDAGGVMRLNWRIVQAPVALIDYVAAHELVHLVHREHGPAFWAMLGKAMPDYEERKRRLRELGPRLVW
jgi:predicted metal-dependent hydrolase